MILRLCIYTLAIGIMVGAMLGASWALGPRRRGPADPNPFESGILPLNGTNIPIPSQFYLIAMFFVIFDLEMVFVFAWAVAVRPAGWVGYAGMLAFLALLLAALAYLWRSGGLDWKQASKRFFFEKKKQKTFMSLDRTAASSAGPRNKNFFGSFFTKKELPS